MKFEILVSRLEKIEKLINKVNKKGASMTITYNLDEAYMKKCEYTTNDGHKCEFYAECVLVDINGEYKQNGWKFIATIEHTPYGNIIRCVDSNYATSIPVKYLTSKPYCEHCNTIRYRKDTYLVYNEEHNEFKQVGKSCLLDFTKGLTPELCNAIGNVLKVVEDTDIAEDEFLKMCLGSHLCGYASSRIKQIAYALVKQYGYVKSSERESTYSRMLAILSNKETIEESYYPSDSCLEEMDKYAKELVESNTNNDFLRNASLSWLLEYPSSRDFCLIASFVSVYLKHLHQLTLEKTSKETTSYVGNIGDRITIDNIQSLKYLYTKSFKVSYYNTSVSFVYSLVDSNGNTYICPLQESGLDHTVVDSIVGTVKDHSEYRGVKQTILSRCKITKKPVEKSTTGSNSDLKAVDMFLNFLDSNEEDFETFYKNHSDC